MRITTIIDEIRNKKTTITVDAKGNTLSKDEPLEQPKVELKQEIIK